MSRPKLGSLFSGVGGLDLAVTEATGAETVFVADVCKVDKHGNVGRPVVTGRPRQSGVTWNEALKACGNGVVPQQGAIAVRHLLDRIAVAA